MWILYISALLYNQFQIFSLIIIINKDTIPLSGYERLCNTFLPLYVGFKLAIDYDINLNTNYHVPYKHFSVEITYSNNNIKKVSPEYHILYPLLTGKEPTYQTNADIFLVACLVFQRK